jgi:hypothetical protein
LSFWFCCWYFLVISKRSFEFMLWSMMSHGVFHVFALYKHILYNLVFICSLFLYNSFIYCFTLMAFAFVFASRFVLLIEYVFCLVLHMLE